MSRIALLCWLLVSAVAHSETRYVTDQLALSLRDAPSSTAGALRPSLRSGDALEVLRRDSGSEYLEVVTEDGRRGWVHGQYLIATPIARDRLLAAEQRIAALEGIIAEQRAALDAAATGGPGDAPADEALKAQMEGLAQQIEGLKVVLAQSDLRRTDSPRGMIRILQDYWPVLGFGFVVLGIIIGVILRFRPKRSAWS